MFPTVRSQLDRAELDLVTDDVAGDAHSGLLHEVAQGSLGDGTAWCTHGSAQQLARTCALATAAASPALVEPFATCDE
jgi:hypothetical protein